MAGNGKYRFRDLWPILERERGCIGEEHTVSVRFCFLRDVGDTQVFIMLFFIPLSMPNICPNLLFKYRFKKCRLFLNTWIWKTGVSECIWLLFTGCWHVPRGHHLLQSFPAPQVGATPAWGTAQLTAACMLLTPIHLPAPHYTQWILASLSSFYMQDRKRKLLSCLFNSKLI